MVGGCINGGSVMGRLRKIRKVVIKIKRLGVSS